MKRIHLLLSALLGCVARGGPEPAIADTQVGRVLVSPAKPRWRSLADTKVDLPVVPNIEVDDLPAAPVALPVGVEARRTNVDLGPRVSWPEEPTWCADPKWFPTACAEFVESTDGLRQRSRRSDVVAGLPEVVNQLDADDDVSRTSRCWYDSLGRVTMRREQIRSSTSACGWRAYTIQQGYDEEGGLAFVQEENVDGSEAERGGSIMETFYEEGLPRQILVYSIYPEPDLPVLSSVRRFTWDGDRLTQADEFDEGGIWRKSTLQVWDEEFVFAVIAPGVGKSRQTWVEDRIYLRRGPQDYAEIFSPPNTRWEYSVGEGGEIVTQYVGELPVERRTFLLSNGQRQLLTVEKRARDVEGSPPRAAETDLVTVERLSWDDDRVVVDLPDSRVTYLFDCSGLPPIESAVDPQCPPPFPIR